MTVHTGNTARWNAAAASILRPIARARRRARLREVLFPEEENEAFLRVFRRRRAARIAEERRQALREKEAAWIEPERALEAAGTGNPHDLNTTLKSGEVRCCFQHVGRHWQFKEVPDGILKAIKNGVRMIGADGTSLVDSEQWKLRINEEDWRKHLGLADVPAQPDAPVQAEAAGLHAGAAVLKGEIVDATEGQIKEAITAVYDEMGDERPSYRNIIVPVRNWLKAKGLYAKWDAIIPIAKLPEFKVRRNERGRTRASRRIK